MYRGRGREGRGRGREGRGREGRGRGGRGRGGRGGDAEELAHEDGELVDDEELVEDEDGDDELVHEDMPDFDEDDNVDILNNEDNHGDNANREQARNLIGRRLESKTKAVYRSKIKILKKWLWINHRDVFDENIRIILPLPDNVIIDFFGYISTRGNRPLLSASTMQGYRSAIKDYLKIHGRGDSKKLKTDVDVSIGEIIGGLKRTIAEMKENGDMEDYAKKPLSYETYKWLCGLFLYCIMSRSSTYTRSIQ